MISNFITKATRPVDPVTATGWALQPRNRHWDIVDCSFSTLLFMLYFHIRNGRRDIVDRGCCDRGAIYISYICAWGAMQK